MFLAIKELKHSKLKFTLIIAVVILVSYLVYFLTSLAYGLASSYTNGVENWESNYVVMTVDANDNLMMSFMDETDFDNTIVDGDKAKLGLFPAVINNPLESEDIDTRLNIYLFGVEDDSFLKPADTDVTLTGNEVVVSDELENSGYEIGDMIAISGSDLELEIKGFTKNATYQTAPIIYMDLASWQSYRLQTNTPPDLFSGVVIKGELTDISDNLASYTIGDYIYTLPGYTAQVLTFSIMIAFLIIIVAFVLGIFIYVLTIQKTPMFGVMKAQGISNRYIAGSVIIQTLLLVLIGIVIGFALTEISIYFLSDIVPLAVNILFYVVITLAFFLFALFGGLFSVNAVLKIDPLKAIGG